MSTSDPSIGSLAAVPETDLARPQGLTRRERSPRPTSGRAHSTSVAAGCNRQRLFRPPRGRCKGRRSPPRLRRKRAICERSRRCSPRTWGFRRRSRSRAHSPQMGRHRTLSSSQVCPPRRPRHRLRRLYPGHRCLPALCPEGRLYRATPLLPAHHLWAHHLCKERRTELPPCPWMHPRRSPQVFLRPPLLPPRHPYRLARPLWSAHPICLPVHRLPASRLSLICRRCRALLRLPACRLCKERKER
jgi:hypothetical protein